MRTVVTRIDFKLSLKQQRNVCESASISRSTEINISIPAVQYIAHQRMNSFLRISVHILVVSSMEDCTFKYKIFCISRKRYLHVKNTAQNRSGLQASHLTARGCESEEVGQASRDNFLPIRFFAQHANGGPRKFSKSESSGSIVWVSVVCVQRIELESIPMV